MRHLKLLADTIRDKQVGIVHLHTCSGFSFFRSLADMSTARRAGCRVVLHIHGATFDEFFAGAGMLKRRLIRRALQRADRVIALSDWWQQKLLQMSPNAKITVVENAVPLPCSPASKQHDGPCRLLLLARMDAWKGIDDLLEACRRLHTGGVDFELVLAGPPGTAGDAAVLDKKICDSDLEGIVRYVGSVRGEEKTKLLEWADFYVQPSHHEGMPISLLEALSHGLPVVATRVGAVPEVVTNGREGLLVPPKEPAKLAGALQRVATDTSLRAAYSRFARALAKSRFSMDRLRSDLLALYDTVCVTQRSPERATSQAATAGQLRVSTAS